MLDFSNNFSRKEGYPTIGVPDTPTIYLRNEGVGSGILVKIGPYVLLGLLR
jgi:hypothetical protein